MTALEPEPGRHPNRRDILTLGVGALAVTLVPMVRRRPTLIRRSIPTMGTIAEVAVVHADEGYAQGAIDAAFAALRAVERTMTRFDEQSEVGRVNRFAAERPIPVSGETALVIAEGLAWAAASDGRFDPCLGRASALWDVGHRRRPPPGADVRRLAGRGFYRGLDLGVWRGAQVVRLADPEAAIDLGGIGKGYAVDRAAQALRDWGITAGLVNVGGDLYAIGRHPSGEPWRIGIRAPHHPESLTGTLPVSDGAVATSGDYLQYFEHGGRRYHHLLDPATGAPRTSALRSVTVAAESCMTADAAATAVFGLDTRDARRILDARGTGARLAQSI